jgi:hypothetical protein
MDGSYHSSHVRLSLSVGASRYELAQVGGNFVIFRDDVELESGEGTLHVVVDAEEDSRPILLLNGRRKGDEIVDVSLT